MKQIIQSYRNGKLILADLPAPTPRPGQVLVQSKVSLVSVGTEKYMLDLARKSLLGKALARPDWVRQVVDKVRSEGLIEAYRQALARLDTPVPLGYSVAGQIAGVGADVSAFRVGDRVACAGTGYASHAEYVTVPENLCVPVPERVEFDAAAFVALGAIAMHGLRMAEVQLGQRLAILGLGLLGQLIAQIAIAAGARVVGMDPDSTRCRLAEELGVDGTATSTLEFAALCARSSGGLGVDSVLISAHTESNEPVELAARVCRERGRTVAVGNVGMLIPRKPFFEKEISFVISRAWGPGAFDPQFEERNVKYPLPYVRWTARENMDEFLRLVAKRQVRLDRIVTHRFPIERALEAYDLVLGKTGEPFLGVLLTYPEQPDARPWVDIRPGRGVPTSALQKPKIGLSLIGGGLYARGTLLPAMKGLPGLVYRGVATLRGVSSGYVAEKFGFAYSTSDYRRVLEDTDTDLVMILTRHDSHARLVSEALNAGKHVFVEKPLVMNGNQLGEVLDAFNARGAPPRPVVMVGFNRRFSPVARWLKERFTCIAEPLTVHCSVNAGLVPPDHWVHDPEQGGGRIIGEVCHFIDLIQYLTGSVPVRVFAETLRSDRFQPSDNVVITLKMANGAIGSIIYAAGGDKRYPRERIEVIGGGAVGVVENFRAATFTRGGRTQRTRRWLGVDRGHRVGIGLLLDAIRTGGAAPVAFEEYVYTTLATFAAEESIRRAGPITVPSDFAGPPTSPVSGTDRRASADLFDGAR